MRTSIPTFVWCERSGQEVGVGSNQNSQHKIYSVGLDAIPFSSPQRPPTGFHDIYGSPSGADAVSLQLYANRVFMPSALLRVASRT